MIMMPFSAPQPGPVAPGPTGPNPPPPVKPNCPGFCHVYSGTSISCDCRSGTAALARRGVCTCEDGSAPIKNAQCDAECNKPTGGVQGSSLTFGQNGFGLEMGYQPYMNYNRMIMMPAAQPGPVTSGPVAPGNVTPKPTPGTVKSTAVRCDFCRPNAGYWKCNSGDCHCNEPVASGTGETGCSDGSKAVVDLSICQARVLPGTFDYTSFETTCSSLTAYAHCENKTCSDGSTPTTKHFGGPGGVMGSALIQRLLPSRFSVGASWNRMNAGYEPEPTTQANLVMAAESNRNNRIAALFGGEGPDVGDVNCGGHKAPSCALCGRSPGCWGKRSCCNGDCFWDDGYCQEY